MDPGIRQLAYLENVEIVNERYLFRVELFPFASVEGLKEGQDVERSDEVDESIADIAAVLHHICLATILP